MPRKSPEDLLASYRIRAHLRREMKERRISKAELARMIGADDGNITRLLNGERTFSAGQVLRISTALGLNPSRLLTDKPPAAFVDEVYEEPKPHRPGR